MNANIMKTQFFHEIENEISIYVIENFCDFFTFRPSDLITTLIPSNLVNLYFWKKCQNPPNAQLILSNI